MKEPIYPDASPAELTERRVSVRAAIRVERQLLVAFEVPDKPWAKQWRAQHAGPVLRRLSELEGELRALDALLGPAPKPFRPRSIPSSLERRLRRFDPTATASAFKE